MSQANISLKKFVKILVWYFFYHMIIGIILFTTGLEQLTSETILDFVYPFRNIGINYFVTAFLFFYVSIPFWRVLIDHFSKRQHGLFILFGYVCYVVYHDIPLLSVQLDAVFWFGYLYIIAAYIRKYIDVDKYHQLSGWISLSFLVLIYSSIFILFYVVKLYPLGLFSSANSTLALGFSIALFIWFKGLKIENNARVNLVAGSTFGVLLIHSGSAGIRNVVWHRFIQGEKWFFSEYYIIYMIISVLTLYIICTIIDIAYKKIIENNLVEFVYQKVNLIKVKYELLSSRHTDTL